MFINDTSKVVYVDNSHRKQKLESAASQINNIIKI